MALTFSQHIIKITYFNKSKETSDLCIKNIYILTSFTVTIANSIVLSLWGSFNNSILTKKL